MKTFDDGYIPSQKAVYMDVTSVDSGSCHLNLNPSSVNY